MGSFMAIEDLTSRFYNEGSVDLVASNASSVMVEISLHENVLNLVSLVFFNVIYFSLSIFLYIMHDWSLFS